MYIAIVQTLALPKNKEQFLKVQRKYPHTFIPFYTADYPTDAFWRNVHHEIQTNCETIEGIIIWGGDGTFHQAINHLQSYRLPFGLVPAGSGNDLARALNIPFHKEKAVRRILAHQKKPHDILRNNGEIVHSVMSLGIDALTALKAANSPIKKFLNSLKLGKITYILAFLQEWRHFTPFTMTLMTDEGKPVVYQKVWLTAFATSPYYGGGIPINPSAVPNDGETNVTIVHSVSRFKLLFYLPAIFLKQHVKLQCVTVLSGQTFHIQPEGRQTLQGDGEKLLFSTGTIETLQDQLFIL